MKLKKFLASALSVTTILSLCACTFNPKDAVSNIINGKDGGSGNANIIQQAENVNKDAVFKEAERFNLEGFDYIDSLITANGKYYVGQVIYDYPEYDGPADPGEVILFDEPAVATDEVIADDETPVDTEETEDELPVDSIDDGEYYEEFNEGEYSDEIKVKFRIASFTDKNDIKYSEIDLGPNEYVQNGSWTPDEDENIILISSTWEPNTGKEEYSVKKYSFDGKLIKESKIDTGSEQYFYVRYLIRSDEGNFFLVSEKTVTLYDKDFNKINSYTSDLQDAYITTVSRIGNDLLFQVNSWTEKQSIYKSYKMDSKGNTAEDSTLAGTLSGKEFLQGEGYDFYYRTGSSVMGMNLGDKNAKEVVNFFDSDINPQEMYGTVCFASKEQFLASSSEYDDEKGISNVEIIVYEKVPADQVKDKEVITLGSVYGAYDVANQIIDFNKASDTYRIKLVDYSEFNTPDDWDAGRKRFYSDLTGGNAPDIIVPEASDVQNLIDKGVFTDLTPLMENSEGLKKEDLVKNARSVFAKDDKLYCIFPTFTVEAIQMKNKNYKEGMTMDDIMAWEKATGKTALSDEMTKYSVLRSFMSLSMDAFLDTKTGKCSFDSDEFVKLLEYANKYPMEIDESYWQDYDYQKYIYEFRNDDSLINFAYVDDFSSYNWNAKYRFGEIPTLTGLPVPGSDGATLNIDTVFGISSKSKKKEAAWEFVKACFTSEYYAKRGWGIPSVEKELDAMAKKATEHQKYIDEDGNEVIQDDSYFLIDHEETIDPLTEAEVAKLKDFVVNVESIYTWDEELNSIVDEETQGYFEGQKSAKEVAAIIQSRLQIYINERK